MHLNTARIFVKDLSAAKAFYANILGLPVVADGSSSGYCVFGAGAAELVVESVANDAPTEDQVLVGRFTGLSFTVDDIHAKYEELQRKGVEFHGAPTRQLWGGTLATLRDPSGNQLQIVQHASAGS